MSDTGALVPTLLHMLDAWERGSLANAAVRDWAEELATQIEWPPLVEVNGRQINDRTAPISAAAYVVDALEGMHVGLICVEDVPALRALLVSGDQPSPGAWVAWDEYWKSVDFAARGSALAADPFYSPGLRR